jgi:hypothetical protein
MLFLMTNVLTMIINSFQFPTHSRTVQLSVAHVASGLPDAVTCAGEFIDFLLL